MTQHSPRSVWILGLLCGIRTVGRMLAPEGFIQFMQAIGVAEAKIGEVTAIQLSHQLPRFGACQAVPKSEKQATQSVWARVGLAEAF